MAEKLPDLVTPEEGTLVLVLAAGGGGGAGGRGGGRHGRKCPPGLSRVFLYYFWSFAASLFFFFWRCRWLMICHSLAQVCFLGVGCEFGLKYSIDQSNNFVRVGNSKTGPALLRLKGICYIYTPNQLLFLCF